jgi:ribosome biogenesis GTPase
VARRRLERPVTGDRVSWLPGPGRTAVIVGIEPRRSLLARPGRDGSGRAAIANLDRLVVVVAAEPASPRELIDRCLVAAAHYGLVPLVLANKLDLIGPAARGALEARLRPYRDLGYAVGKVSVVSGQGLRELALELRGHASAVVGPSGVGKSSLVRALVPGAEATVGELSRGTGHGRHTTSVSTLFHLPDGGHLIDSPGVRDIGLWHLPRASVALGFPEIAALAGQCRFRDCSHGGEPDCALQAAQAEGRVDPQRLASYRAILAEVSDSRR